MKCFYHPAVDAVAQCAQCYKGICSQCANHVDGATLCPACMHVGVSAEVAKAKRAITMMYVVVGGVTALVTVLSIFLLANAASQPGSSGGSIASAFLGVPIIAVVTFIQWWCLYWGWGPVWGAFSRFFAGWGCFGTWTFLLIIAAIIFEFLLIAAFFVGLFTGIQRFLEARRIVANGTSMLQQGFTQ